MTPHRLNEIRSVLAVNHDAVSAIARELLSALESAERERDAARDALRSVQKRLSYTRLTCECVNWMGGCSSEYGCNYGVVKAAKRMLHAALSAPGPDAQRTEAKHAG